MRDMRDPEKLGKAYLAARKRKKPYSIQTAVNILVDPYESQDVIQRYGSANDLEPKWMVVQVK